MAIESWKMSKVPLKSDNVSLDMTLSWRNHNLWGTSKAKWSDPGWTVNRVKISNFPSQRQKYQNKKNIDNIKNNSYRKMKNV